MDPAFGSLRTMYSKTRWTSLFRPRYWRQQTSWGRGGSFAYNLRSKIFRGDIFHTHILSFVIGMSSVLISRLARKGERKFGSKCAGPGTTLSVRFGDCAQFFNRVVSIYMHACCTHSLRRHLTHVLHLLVAKVYDIVWDQTIANAEANDISHYVELMVES